MAKANQKINKENKKQELGESIAKSFEDWEQLLNQIKETAIGAQMPLLAQSIDLDLSILKTYRKAFMYTVNE